MDRVTRRLPICARASYVCSVLDELRDFKDSRALCLSVYEELKAVLTRSALWDSRDAGALSIELYRLRDLPFIMSRLKLCLCDPLKVTREVS
jgi:hypothetical protein